MKITVQYKKREYGTGAECRQYRIIVREARGLYIEKPTDPSSGEFYPTRELAIQFRAKETVAARGLDFGGDLNAEVFGGEITLSHDAARKLATAILESLENQTTCTSNFKRELEIVERPERADS